MVILQTGTEGIKIFFFLETWTGMHGVGRAICCYTLNIGREADVFKVSFKDL